MTENEKISWELAKRKVDALPEPKLPDKAYLPLIEGFECSFHRHPEQNNSEVILWNDLDNICYPKTYQWAAPITTEKKKWRKSE